MVRSRQARRAATKLSVSAVMIAIGVLMVLPFVWMLSTSFKIELDVFNFPVQWIPPHWDFGNYVTIWLHQSPPFYVYYLNSMKVTFFCVVGDLITSSLAAYGFSRLRFRGRDAIFLLYLGTMMIPFQVLMVPRFILFRYMGIYNTHWALILPGMFTTLGVFLLRQFMLQIPFELSEAARIEGARESMIYRRIIVPLSTPALASLAILEFVWRWNDYISPLVFITSRVKYTIPVGLTNFINLAGGMQYTLIMAASVSALVPIFVVFLVGQRYFISGITAGSVKG